MSNQEIYEFAKRLVDTEKDYAERLKSTAKKAENEAVKALIEAVAMDSLKHSRLYEAIAKGLSNVELLTVAETEPLIGEIDYHIRTEAEFIKELREKISKCENETVKFILNTILKDEIYHHTLLTAIKEQIIEKRKKLDEQLWKLIWSQVIKE